MKYKGISLKIGKERILTFIYIVILCIGIVASYDSSGDKDEVVETFAMPLSKKIVVIDAGHGGWDRGAYS